ncbi:MAG TPA: TlpA disulfide reductase family protein [Pyrinomonadaceae bacterium]|nr:TlpA disulfide reductase family protein [Pyrinomonadaceae bacterium]
MIFTWSNAARVRFLKAPICCALLTTILACQSADPNNTPVVSGPPSTTFPMPPASGKSLSNMGWQLADGQHNFFSQYIGSVLILDFYATWCIPCRKSIPQLVSLQDRFKGQGLRVVGLNVGGPPDWPKVADFARELKIQYTLAVPDADLTGFLLSDSQQIPQTFVFDRQGRLTKRIIGFSDSDSEVLKSAVESALKD